MVESPAVVRLPIGTLAPHPPIAGAYTTLDQKKRFVDAIFDDTAQDYDRVERWLSLGSGAWYRGKALARAGLKPGMSVADVAVGTGLVAGAALKIIGPGGRIVGIDPSVNMMSYARERLGIQTATGTAESLPLENSSVDFLSMGYALRHVESLNGALGEFHRVLKPGGRVCILEITRPRTALGRALLRVYLGTLCRAVGLFRRLAPRTPELWSYYWETIDKCTPPDKVIEALKAAGFTNVRRNVVGAVFSEYTGLKP